VRLGFAGGCVQHCIAESRSDLQSPCEDLHKRTSSLQTLAVFSESTEALLGACPIH